MVSEINSNGNFSNAKLYELQSELKKVEDKQGLLGRTWNGFKEFFNVGVTQDDCEKMLKKYENGTISFEDALEYIEKFNTKQENAVDLITNIATGIGAITFTTLTAGTGAIAWGVALASAPVGAGIKSVSNILDRATNEIDNDALDVKEVTKDLISGAVTGATSSVSSGIFKGRMSGTMQLGASIRNGAVCGIECGALSGSTGYLTDVALDEDKNFKFGDLVTHTVSNSLISGAVGGVVGAGAYADVVHNGIFSRVNRDITSQSLIEDSALSSFRKLASSKVRDKITSAKAALA